MDVVLPRYMKVGLHTCRFVRQTSQARRSSQVKAICRPLVTVSCDMHVHFVRIYYDSDAVTTRRQGAHQRGPV